MAAGLGFSSHAHATELLTFGQESSANTVTATVSGDTTTISGNNILVDVTSYAGGGSPFVAYLTFSLTSNSAISGSAVGGFTQSYSGSASWTNANASINYMSADFEDQMFAVGASETLMAAEPSGTITFTSGILPSADFVDPLGLSFSLANVVPMASATADGQTLAPFTATVSGTTSGNFSVPEPASMAVLGAGLAGLGLVRRRRI